MKIALVTLFFAASALAQGPSAVPTAACGPKDNVSFKVKLDDTQHTPMQPEPGKARIYFIHESWPNGLTYPTTQESDWTERGLEPTRIPIHSVSRRAGRASSVRYVAVLFVGSRVELAHFTVEAGKVYYFRTRLIWDVAKRGVIGTGADRQRSRQVSDCHLSTEHFDAEEVKQRGEWQSSRTWLPPQCNNGATPPETRQCGATA
jgi:hypothetical protein